MSFFKFNKSSSTTNHSGAAQSKKDANAPQPTPLEKHLADTSGPVRPDGSDKFFGFENYGSTCYCNSIIQCLYYSAPFRQHVINFPSTAFIEELRKRDSSGEDSNGAPVSPRATSTTPYPNPTSPARKTNPPTSPGPGVQRPEDQKDSPENRKKLALAAGPVLGMTNDNSNKYFMEESLFTSLREIFEAIIANESRIGVVSPHRFLDILKRDNEMFRSAMHQDAHEFLNLLLNSVVDKVEAFAKQHPALVAPRTNGTTAPENSSERNLTVSNDSLHSPKNELDTHWVHDLFEGLLTSETRCLTCENTSQRDEAFLDLSVDLSPHTSVTSCLRKFSEEEMLCERNKFHCDNCGGLQEAEKRMKIKRLPRILALHLKRFKFTEDLQRLQKLFHRVQYPFHLRLFNTTDDAEDPDRLYELYAVVVHIGAGPYHGHYVCIIKTEDRGWLLFDDELVEPVEKSYVMNFFGGEPIPGLQDAKQLACAYVLFYQETTMEAMLKEQAMEGGDPHHIPSRVSDETALDPSSPTMKSANGIFPTLTAQSPTVGDLDHMDPLAHASTAPTLLNPPNIAEATQTSPLEHTQSTLLEPRLPSKTKRELKQEEKERKAAKKAEEKAEEKAADERRKEASSKRIEAWRKADEEMKQVLEMSKETAANEAKDRGDAPAKESGFSLFRHGSMSLRKKPALFNKDKDKEKDKEAHKVPAVPEENGSSGASEDIREEHNADLELATALPPLPAHANVHALHAEEKTKKHRFSLGRKKSTMM